MMRCLYWSFSGWMALDWKGNDEGLYTVHKRAFGFLFFSFAYDIACLMGSPGRMTLIYV